MDIFKIVVNEAGTLNRYVDGQIFFDKGAACIYADEIAKEGAWDDHEISSVHVYRETPENDGRFRTIGEVAKFEIV